jgi:hypothetical protein
MWRLILQKYLCVSDLFDDIINNPDYTGPNDRIMNRIGCGTDSSWPNLRHNPDTLLQQRSIWARIAGVLAEI